MKINFPTILTLTRLIIGPLVVPFLIVYLIPSNNIIMNCAVGAVFIILSITDLLDGYLARKLNNETELGKLLDHMADKFLTYSSLIGLITAHKIFFVWVLIFIGREFFVMGLRMLAQDYQLFVPVSYLGKLKTVSQAAYIAAAIINPYHDTSHLHLHHLI